MTLGLDFDTVLIAAQAGAEWAFSRLYRDLNPRLLRYLAAQAPGEAEDLAAETWLGAARRLGSFSGDEDAFRAWMFTIAHHRLVQHWRSVKRRPVAPADPYDMPERPSGEDLESSVVGGLTAMEASRRIAAVLSPDQAEVVLLRVLGGLDTEQVAEIVRKRPGAVRVLQHRALKRLAAQNFSPEGVTP
jgi:RNA polymerase sigma-70 factor (ECF subfamily)